MINEMKRRIDEMESRQKWQPIETAPIGVDIIGRGFYDFDGKVKMKPRTVVYNGRSAWRDNDGYGMTVMCYPTEWMPLPDAPR